MIYRHHALHVLLSRCCHPRVHTNRAYPFATQTQMTATRLSLMPRSPWMLSGRLRRLKILILIAGRMKVIVSPWLCACMCRFLFISTWGIGGHISMCMRIYGCMCYMDNLIARLNTTNIPIFVSAYVPNNRSNNRSNN